MNRLISFRGGLASFFPSFIPAFFFLACLSGALFIGADTHAADLAPRALSLEEAATLALRRQPQLLAQQAAVAALVEAAPAAGQLPDPKLRVGLLSLPVDTFNFDQEAMTQASIGISQLIPGGDKRRLATVRVEREAAQGDQALAAIAQRISRDARLAWLDVYSPSAAEALVGKVEAEYQRQVEWSEVAYKTNKISQDETLALRGMLESTRDRLAELARQRNHALVGLARWVGSEARRPLDTLPTAAPPAPLSELLEKLGRHPELTALNEAVAVAQSEVAQAREAYKPDWSVDLSYGLRGGNRADLVSFVVGVDLPVFTANRQDKRLASRLAGVERAEQTRLDRYQSLKAELEAAYADWQSADSRIAHYAREILPLAGRRVESALAAYGGDRANYSRVLEARRAETEARLQLLAQQVARAKALAQIRYFSAL
ncbi:MAG: TolC family protein [Gallionellaceae bacterium]|nr:TolC family protein [Gallionellaceae bacterium]